MDTSTTKLNFGKEHLFVFCNNEHYNLLDYMQFSNSSTGDIKEDKSSLLRKSAFNNTMSNSFKPIFESNYSTNPSKAKLRQRTIEDSTGGLRHQN